MGTRVLCGKCGKAYELVGRAVPGRRYACPYCFERGVLQQPDDCSGDGVLR